MTHNAARKVFLATLLGVLASPLQAQEIDTDAANALAKKGNCFKCHAIDKRKKAPSYKEIARKHRDETNAEETLMKHINGKPMVKLDEGDEPHEPPPTKDRTELLNLVRWILAL